MPQIQHMREAMVKELELTGIPAEAQDEIISAVGENIVRAVTLAVILKLPAGEQEEFKKLTEAQDSDGIEKLIKKNIPDSDAFIQEEARKEIAAFKETLAKKLAQ